MESIPTNTVIRLLTEPDFTTATEIFREAFSHPDATIREMAFLHDLQPCGRFIALYDDQPVGLVGAVDYGRIVYVGQLAVLPAFQGKGIGRTLMQHVLQWITDRGARVTLLEATPSGARLYPSMGFVVDDETLVFGLSQATWRTTGPPQVAVMQTNDLEPVADFDSSIFGSNRARLFKALMDELPGRSFVTRTIAGQVSGYLFAQQGRLGPWAARGYNEARDLLHASLALDYQKTPRVVIPQSNKVGIELVQEHGFRFERSMLHMRLGGQGSPSQRERLYGLATPGIG